MNLSQEFSSVGGGLLLLLLLRVGGDHGGVGVVLTIHGHEHREHVLQRFVQLQSRRIDNDSIFAKETI